MEKKRIYFFIFGIVALSAVCAITVVLRRSGNNAARSSSIPKVEVTPKTQTVSDSSVQKKQRSFHIEQEAPLGNKPLLN
jgi:hypothetical protein